MAVAIGWSLLWSLPQCSDWLRGSLERQYPVVAETALPQADAIVVLGGATHFAWLDRDEVQPDELKGSRVAAGARAWLAKRAPVIVLSGSGGEARVMATAMVKLGIPASALLLEPQSKNTSDNALYTARLAQRHGIRRVLLVTSSLHMPRASLLFRQAGIDVVPVPVLERPSLRQGWGRWLPSRSALWRSGRALKEYAGLFAVFLEPR